MKEVYLHENDMPTSCEECPFTESYSDFPNVFCKITSELVSDDEDFEYERHSTCPLRVLKAGD